MISRKWLSTSGKERKKSATTIFTKHNFKLNSDMSIAVSTFFVKVSRYTYRSVIFQKKNFKYKKA